MGILKRSIISILKNKGKMGILFLIIFLSGSLISSSIFIKNNTKNTEKNIKDRLGLSGSLIEDISKINTDYNSGIFPDVSFPNIETIEQIGNLSQVKYFNYTIPNYLTVEDTKLASSTNQSKITEQSNSKKTLFIEGISYHKLLPIEENKINLIEGNIFSKKDINELNNKAIVSKEFSKENSVTVGDKITLDNHIKSNTDNNSILQEIPIEIIGIFDINTDEVQIMNNNISTESKENKQTIMDSLLNTIYINNNYSKKINDEKIKLEVENFPENFEGIQNNQGEYLTNDEQIYTYLTQSDFYETKFILNNSKDIDSFKNESKNILRNYPYITMSMNVNQYDSIAQPINSLEKTSNMIMIITIIITIFIVSLVMILFIRDRKKEFGIYIALGEKKINILMHVFSEVLIIASLALLLSNVTGYLIADNMSTVMLNTSEIIEHDHSSEEENQNYQDITSIIDQEDVINSYRIDINMYSILLFYFVGNIIIIISTILPLIYLFKLRPKEILL